MSLLGFQDLIKSFKTESCELFGLPSWATEERFGMVHIDFNNKEPSLKPKPIKAKPFKP